MSKSHRADFCQECCIINYPLRWIQMIGSGEVATRVTDSSSCPITSHHSNRTSSPSHPAQTMLICYWSYLVVCTRGADGPWIQVNLTVTLILNTPLLHVFDRMWFASRFDWMTFFAALLARLSVWNHLLAHGVRSQQTEGDSSMIVDYCEW